MRLREAGVDPPDFELQPVSLFQVVNAAVERQEEFEGMIVHHIYPVRI
jgi:hypothetical protein